ncbi:MAG TPA: glycoside hydrolase family 44 protein [Methylomirabilota bacterium]|nr:glycoside hydrolase family 44 protein [Methylomirabilota bacterium]
MVVGLTLLNFKAAGDQTVYTDSLQNGWVDWSWATVNLTVTSPKHAGTAAISVSCSNYSALYLHHTAFDGSAFTNLTFWVHGGASGGQSVQVQATRNGVGQAVVVLAALPANSWRLETISLASLGVAAAADFDGFWIQNRSAGATPVFYVDDISLVAGSGVVSNAPTSIVIDAQLNRHPINPLVYGVAFATSNQLADLNSPLNRSGGNSETRYNWQLNAHNHAADWYFESLADSPATPGASGDDFVANSRNGGAQPMITIPMIGWLPKLGPSRARLCSYSIAKYGAQTGNDSQWFADAGNGIASSNSAPITSNDPNDASFLTNSLFQQAYVQHLTNLWGKATNGGVPYYIMDNEHTLWNSTHRDVHPIGTSMQEIRDKFFDYAAKVKAVDPNALIVGPEEWGWSGYFYSGFDQHWAGANNDYNPAHFPDRSTNGGWDYLPWFLDQARQRGTNTGQRLLDVFTVHYYPQGNEFGNDTSQTMQLLRNRSTRSLWDTNYVDASWIQSVVKLIPRLKSWVASYYPGTKIGLTEYNWGAEGHINGATAQADIYGILGRENIDLATRWTTPDASTPTYKAMKMFRNYDGNKSGFGDISVAASAPNPDNVSVFAAVRSIDGALTAMVINKQLSSGASPLIVLTNFVPSGKAQVWQLTSANSINHLSDVTFTGNTFSNTVPAQSITLYVLTAGVVAPPHLVPGSISSNVFNFRLDGVAGQRYAIQASTNFVIWVPVQTNTLATNSMPVAVSASMPYRFYRAQWLP